MDDMNLQQQLTVSSTFTVMYHPDELTRYEPRPVIVR